MSAFHAYSNNTKYMYIIICFSLLLIVVTTIASTILGFTKVIIVKLIALALIGYALYINSFETNKLIKNMPDLFSDPKLVGIRNNALLSCTLCASMGFLFLFLLITLKG